MKEQYVLSLSLFLLSLTTTCSENILLLENGYYAQRLSKIESNLRHNIAVVQKLQQTINPSVIIINSEDDITYETIDELHNTWNKTKKIISSAENQLINLEKEYLFIFPSREKNKCLSYANISFSGSFNSKLYPEKNSCNSCDETYFDFLAGFCASGVGAILGILSFAAENAIFNHSQYENQNLIAPAIIGTAISSGIRIVGMICRKKATNNFLRDHPEYLIIKRALQNLNLKSVDI